MSTWCRSSFFGFYKGTPKIDGDLDRMRFMMASEKHPTGHIQKSLYNKVFLDIVHGKETDKGPYIRTYTGNNLIVKSFLQFVMKRLQKVDGDPVSHYIYDNYSYHKCI